MKKLAVLASLSTAFVLSGCDQILDATPEHCKADYIKSIADKEGLDKAQELTNKCLEQGFSKAQDAVANAGKAFEDAGKTLKEGLFGKSEGKE